MSQSQASTVAANVAYFVNENFHTLVTFGSANGTSIIRSGSFTPPSGSTISGTAGFDDGRFFAASTLIRAGAFDFGEVLTSSSDFRDVLSINTNTCPQGGPACSLAFQYTASGTFFATGPIAFAGQLDFAVRNPNSPFDRSTWLVDNPVFLTPGVNTIQGEGSVAFFDNEPFVFWPLFSTVARKVEGADGESKLNFLNSLVFDSFTVLGSNGSPIASSISAESGLSYSAAGLSAVPEPASLLLVGSAIGLIVWKRKRLRDLYPSPEAVKPRL